MPSYLPRLHKSLANWKFWDKYRVRIAPGDKQRRRPPLSLETLEDRCVPSATITGTVFEDFKANSVQVVNGTIHNAAAGTIGVASDGGMAGVTVTAYNAAGAVVAAATTAANGTYALTDAAGSAATPYRVEFTTLPPGFTDGPEGAGSQSSVQFVTGSTNNVDLGLLRASDYIASSNPTLYSQIYHTGDPNLPGTITLGNGQTYTPSANPSDPALVSFSYSAGTTASDTTLANYQAPNTHTISVPVGAIGTTWGLAFNSVAQQLYASAYTKRFASYGPGAGGMSNGDPGAIYKIDPTTGAVSLFASIPNMANFRALAGPGDTPYANNSSYEADNGSDPTNPNLGWQSVGTTSLGGMDVNADGTQLYVMDLQHRTLDILGVKADGTWDGTLTAVAVPIPADASAAANMRPFAVKYDNGLVYIGEVDSAQSTQSAAQLHGYVFAFNPGTNAFNPAQVLEFSFNYARGGSYGGSDDFHPWAAAYQNINGNQSGNGPTKYPQPMLTGIAFDAAGNMSLGVRDRNGDQTTRFLESDPGHDPNTQEGISAGATLRAAPNAGLTAWTLENNGVSGGVATGGAGSGFGPGGGMYYYQDNYDNSDTARGSQGGHNDVTLGGVEQVPGFPDLVVTSFDPDQHAGSAPGQSASFRTGGVRWFHDGNDPLGNAGTDAKGYMLYSIDAPGTFGKADGVGNVVAQTFPAPLEIGNRVWKDANGNGIQDAGEPILPNVTVTLFDVTAGTTVGTTTTDPNGDYLFNNSNVIGGLLPNHAYEVRIAAAQANLTGLALTRPNVGPDPLVNSKAVLAGGNAVIALTTGAFGRIDHTFDAGFEPLAQVAGVVFDNTVENDGVFHAATDPGINGVTVTLGGKDDLGNSVSMNTITITIGGQAGSYLFNGLRPSNAAGYTITETGVGVPASFIDGKDSVPGSLGGNLANQRADQVTAIPVAAGDNGIRYNFGEIKPAQVAGVVFDNTVENDGAFHAATDPGINGVTVTLAGTDDLGNPVSMNTTTSTLGGQAGSYLFSGLRPSNGAGYTITETGVGVPALFIDGKDSVPGSLGGVQANPTADQVTAVVVHANDNGVNYNFGEIKPAQIAGVIFDNTVENDGVFHAATDPGINGVTVTLAGKDDLGNPVSMNTTTSTLGGQAGSYLFIGLRPSNGAGYIITETGTGVPASFIDGKDSVPGSLGGNLANQRADQVTAIPVAAGDNGIRYNFGEIKPAQVAGVVFDNTVENDGAFHAATDPGINGVTVTLAGTDDLGNAVSMNTTTITIGGQAGSYLFNGLRPSNAAGYTITETGVGVPASFIDGKDSVPGSLGGVQANPTADQVTAVVVHANDKGINYNFGEIQPAAAVSGTVFSDYNNDGVESGPDQGIGGTTITLAGTDSKGRPVYQTTSTAADGSYHFIGLLPGNYTVTETQPGGYFDGKDILGSMGGTNAVKNQLANILLGPGQIGSAYNFAEVPMVDPTGSVYVDLNENNILDPGEPGIPGVMVTLTGNNVLGQTVTRTVLTDGNGAYQFDDLAPGLYLITETQPGGYVHGGEQNGNPPATTVAPHQFIGIDLTRAPFFGAGYNFGELLGGFPGGVVPPLVAPTGPEVDPTFVSKTLLLGSGANGAPDSNVAYVNILYHQVLGRVADVDGLNAWVFQLDSGVSRSKVADEIWRSPEHRGLQVDQFYQTFLHRAADPAARAAWVASFMNGASESSVAAAFLTSGEYLASHASDAAFVAGVYQDALNRQADGAGLAAWTSALGNGASRQTIALDLLTSAESSQGVLDRLYAQFLGRGVDSAGESGFLPLLQQGGQTTTAVADAILGSDEFYNRFS